MVQKYLSDWGFGVIAALGEVAQCEGATIARVALAWLLAQPGVTAANGGTFANQNVISVMGRWQRNFLP